MFFLTDPQGILPPFHPTHVSEGGDIDMCIALVLEKPGVHSHAISISNGVSIASLEGIMAAKIIIPL